MVDFYDREQDFEKSEDEPRSVPQGELQKVAQGEQEAPIEEPYFPTPEEAVELNGAAHEAYGNSYQGLRAPNELESAINRAQQHYYYGPEENDQERLATAGAKMAYGLGMNQPFVDGNKRTAFWLTRHFLNENGLGHVLPADQDDEEFADHLIGHGAGTHSEQDTINLFLNRLKGGQQRQANILDKIHDDLDPRVWDDPASPEPKLKHEHHEFIFEKVLTTLEAHGYDGMERWLSLVFTGSLTTYQYSDDSDVDISLFVDTVNFPDWSRAEMIGVMVANCDGTTLPGTPFPLQCFVVPPGITREDLYQPGMRSGYELATDTWIVPPDKSRVHDVEHEMNEAYTIALENADKMERLLRYEPDKATQFWHQIHKRRQRDMKAGLGDYAPSNITYKMLSNRGLFPSISQASGEYIAHHGSHHDNSNTQDRTSLPLFEDSQGFVTPPQSKIAFAQDLGDETSTTKGSDYTHIVHSDLLAPSLTSVSSPVSAQPEQPSLPHDSEHTKRDHIDPVSFFDKQPDKTYIGSDSHLSMPFDGETPKEVSVSDTKDWHSASYSLNARNIDIPSIQDPPELTL